MAQVQAVQAANAVCNCPQQVEFVHKPGLAQYKGSDYANAVRVERGITVEQAKQIAANDPEIDYFQIVTGGTMVLEFIPGQNYDSAKDPLHLVTNGGYVYDNGQPGGGYMRLFHHGDVVFFKKEGQWLGTAPCLADVYEKVN